LISFAKRTLWYVLFADTVVAAPVLIGWMGTFDQPRVSVDDIISQRLKGRATEVASGDDTDGQEDEVEAGEEEDDEEEDEEDEKELSEGEEDDEAVEDGKANWLACPAATLTGYDRFWHRSRRHFFRR
jgi:hypothetical protein